MKEANRAPAYASMYHGLCDTARKNGYALAIHGSVVTDLDLIAVPWTDEAVSDIELVKALSDHISALDYKGILMRDLGSHTSEENIDKLVAAEQDRVGEKRDGDGSLQKPHGRKAWNLYLDFGAKVDLSVMPRVVI